YNGTSFSPVGGVVNGSVRSMAVWNNSLVVSGTITGFGSLASSNIARWDGTNWSALGSGVSTYALALGVHHTHLYASGSFVAGRNLLMFNGTAWTIVPGGFSDYPYAIASYNGKLYAGGFFTQAGSALASKVASFDGTNWSDVGGGLSGGTSSIV